MNVSGIMDGLGVRLATITGLRVFDFIPDSVSPPAAMVALPEIFYDLTMARNADRATFPVHVVVGKASDRNARDRLAAYVAGTGASSVKAAIEAAPTLGGVADSLRVTEARVSIMTFGAQEFLAATFDVDVVG